MSLRSPKAHGRVTRAILCGHLKEKCRTPSVQELFCVDIYRKSAGPGVRVARFVRACAVETHMDISQAAFYAENLQEKLPHTTPPTSIENRALTGTVRTPSVWPHCLGSKNCAKFTIFMGELTKSMAMFNGYCM